MSQRTSKDELRHASSEPPVRVLVDDHPMMRDAARTVLEALGGFALVAEAATGEAALELAGRMQPDLALVDVALPGIDGIAVARRLTAVDQGRPLSGMDARFSG